MKFNSIEMQNFLSFGPLVTLDLCDRGLVAVFGQNRDTSEADSNGSGKSSLMEAIVWALYGETMRGYKGDQVINRHVGKDCLCRISLEDDQNTYTITRYRKLKGVKKPNDVILEINGKPVTQGVNADTQALITTIVGMDYATFTQSVMLYHGNRSFSEMKDSEQKQVLEEILQIDELAKAQAIVKRRIIISQQSMVGTNAKLEAIDTRRTQGKVQLHKLTQQRNQHRTIMRQRKLELTQQKASAEVQMEEVYRTTGLDVLLESQKTLQDRVTELETLRSDIVSDEIEIVKSFGDKKSVISNEEGQIQGRMNQVSPVIQAMNSLAGKECPTCHRVVAPDEATATIDAMEERGVGFQKRMDTLDKKRTKLATQEQRALLRVHERKDKLSTEMSRIRAELLITTEGVHKRRNHLRLICQLEQQVFNLRDEIDSLDDSENPYNDLVGEAETEIDDLYKQSRILNYAAKALDIELRHLNFWDQGFSNRGLKSYVIENILPFLNERAQYYADMLTGGTLKIEFSMLKELKKGGFKEEFQVHVINESGADVYKGNSTGEKRRIDLAVGWALGDLAATRAKKPIQFKGLDEPFENLDESGEDAVIKLLHSVLGDYETIVCVTHSTHLRQQFPSEVLVRKENGISALV